MNKTRETLRNFCEAFGLLKKSPFFQKSALLSKADLSQKQKSLLALLYKEFQSYLQDFQVAEAAFETIVDYHRKTAHLDCLKPEWVQEIASIVKN